MKTRPFGSLAWGTGIILSLAVVFAVSTMALMASSGRGAKERGNVRTERAPSLGRALATTSAPAIALGRYANSGQSQELGRYVAAMSQLEAGIQEAARTFDPTGSEHDGLARAEQQVTRALTLGRQVMSQPGLGLLNAGSSGSADEVGAQAIAAASTTIGSLLQAELERRAAIRAAGTASNSPELSVWYASWGAAFALLFVFLGVTASKQEAAQTPVASSASRVAKPPFQKFTKSATGAATYSSVATQLEAARLDAPTGLLNRVALAPLVSKSIEQSLQKGLTIGMISLEIDGFKEVRQTLGPNVANALISEAGRLIKETFRRNDHVARLRDAEFVIMVNEISGRDILNRLEERLHEAVAEVRLPELKGRDIKANIGLAMYPIDGYSDEDLVTAARNAVLYRNAVPPSAEPVIPAAIVAPEPPKTAEPEQANVAAVEEEAEKSLQELHALIGQYLSAARGTIEKQEHAHLLIGEFKKRG